MATVDDHEQQWQHNRSLIARLPPDAPDWIVTVTFYTALHAVDSLLCFDKVPGIVEHRNRSDVLARTNRYAQIWRHYQPLYSLSRTVRYMAKPQEWVPFQLIQRNVIDRYLYPIEQSVLRLTARQLALPPVALAAA